MLHKNDSLRSERSSEVETFGRRTEVWDVKFGVSVKKFSCLTFAGFADPPATAYVKWRA